jgi:uncharacterized protein YegP (UPF0339 family)
MGDAYVEIYRRTDDRFDWRLVASNGETLCGSDQGYERVGAVLEGWALVQQLANTGTEVRYAEGMEHA